MSRDSTLYIKSKSLAARILGDEYDPDFTNPLTEGVEPS